MYMKSQHRLILFSISFKIPSLGLKIQTELDLQLNLGFLDLAGY